VFGTSYRTTLYTVSVDILLFLGIQDPRQLGTLAVRRSPFFSPVGLSLQGIVGFLAIEKPFFLAFPSQNFAPVRILQYDTWNTSSCIIMHDPGNTIHTLIPEQTFLTRYSFFRAISSSTHQQLQQIDSQENHGTPRTMRDRRR
jgi:hypothetical protein